MFNLTKCKVKKFLLLGLLIITVNLQAEKPLKDINQNSGEIINIDEKEAHQLIMTGQVIPVDVRTPEEYDKGYIKYSVNIDYKGDDFVRKMDYLRKDKPILLYCRSGRRSLEAAKILTDLGYDRMYNLRGGIISWNDQVNMILKKN
jgi:rhodanese-related sulfurtransferase